VLAITNTSYLSLF